jgi:hypothetical protein
VNPEPAPQAARVALSWKVYTLGWAWLGIIAGVLNTSLTATVVVWAIGASAAWLLAPTIQRAGWGRAGLVALVSVSAVVGGLWFILYNWSGDNLGHMIGTLVGVWVLGSLRSAAPARHSSRRQKEQPLVDRCPSCGTAKAWVRRPADQIIACWRCGTPKAG